MITEMELHAIASLLRRGRSLDELSTGLALLGALIGIWHGLTGAFNGWVASTGALLLVLGVVQKCWAIRVAFDADLLQRLADSPQPLPDSTQALDQALAALRLQPGAKAGRPWAERRRGALGLLYQQALLLAAQIALMLGLILSPPWLLNAV